MSNKELMRRRAAGRLALIEETDHEALEEATKLVSKMKYSGTQAAVVANALRNRYKPEVKKIALAEIGAVDEFEDDLEGAMPEPEDNVEFAGEVEDHVEFKGEEEDETEISLEEGETYQIRIGDEVLTIKLEEASDENLEETEQSDKNEEEFDNEDDNEEPVLEEPTEEDNVVDTEKERGITAMSKENLKQARREILAELNDRNLDGEEKARPSAKTMKMKSVTELQKGNEAGKTMTLTGSEGNSLVDQNVKDFLSVKLPTDTVDDRFLNHSAKDKVTLDGTGGDLVEQFRKLMFADSDIPDNGGDKGMFGEDKPTQTFEVPTQNPKETGQRKVTASERREARRQILAEISELLEKDEFGLNDYVDEEETPELTDEVDLNDETDVLDIKELLGEEKEDEPELEPEPEFEPELEPEGFIGEAFNKMKTKLANQNYSRGLYKDNLNDSVTAQKIASCDCDGCNNPEKLPVEVVECQDCGAKLVLCERDLEEEFCPGCADLEKMASELAAKEVMASNADYGDELCEAPSKPYGGKENGDGFLHKPGKPKEDGEDEAVTAEVTMLRNKLAAAEVEKARIATASRTAVRMAERGVINESEIEDQIEEFLNNGMTVNAMKNFESAITKIASKNQKNRVATASVKTASHEGLMTNIAIPSNNDTPVDLTSTLRGVFMDKDVYRR